LSDPKTTLSSPVHPRRDASTYIHQGLAQSLGSWHNPCEEDQQRLVFGADLIIMGTQGRTGLPHLLLGSVAEQVVRLVPCPVLVTRPATYDAVIS